MEELTEQIAREIGPKWVQLLSRLRLDYRERFKFCANHKNEEKTLQEANCTRDTIRLWQKGIGDVSERETMIQLLVALKTVKGFDERAKELAQSSGICHNHPLLPLKVPPQQQSVPVQKRVHTHHLSSSITPRLTQVWWMPDCGPEQTVALLNQLVHRTLKIVTEPLRVNISRWDTGRALLDACLNNDWGRAEALIKEGSFLGARSKDGRTPLMLACVRGKEKIVGMLIERGADVQAVDARGEACLNYTETLRNQVILECILIEYRKLKVTVDVESLESGCSPLSTACKCGAFASVELLLKYGANPNGCKNGRHRPLVEASAQGHVGLVNMLLQYGADIDSTGSNGYTALLQACTSHHWGVAQVLMNEGADVNKCV